MRFDAVLPRCADMPCHAAAVHADAIRFFDADDAATMPCCFYHFAISLPAAAAITTSPSLFYALLLLPLFFADAIRAMIFSAFRFHYFVTTVFHATLVYRFRFFAFAAAMPDYFTPLLPAMLRHAAARCLR